MISVRPLGILGIGIAVLIGQFSKCVLESYFGQRNLKFPWEYKRLVWSMLLIFFGGYVISLNLVDNSNYLYRLLLALSLIIISAVPLFSRQEISTVVRFFNKLIKQV